MKRRILYIMMAGFFLVVSLVPIVEVKAEPNGVGEARNEYEELTKTINDLNEKIQKIDGEINPLVIQINDNMNKINDIDADIKNTNAEIEEFKADISEQEDVLGNRLREMYKSGGEVSYLKILFSSDSLSDLISKVSSAKRVVDLDNELIDNLNEEKDKLYKEVRSLQEKSEEITELNNEIEETKKELETKKIEQQKILEETKIKQDDFDKKYLATAEREIVESFINTANNSNCSKRELQIAVNQLTIFRDQQIKSPTVINEIQIAIDNANKYIASKVDEVDTYYDDNEKNRGVTVSSNVQPVIDLAFMQIGKWYEYGADGPETFDCSGLTSYLYKNTTGIWIGRSTYDQINSGVEVSYNELQPGDLIFPHSGHVGIYIGNNKMIHAPHTGDQVKVANVYSFWRARRILN